MAVRLTFFAIISLKILIIESVLPPYVPALHCGQRSRDSLIEQYFNLGFGYTEILAFLCIVHGSQLSVRHLKRILARKGLRRRGDQSGPFEVISAVDKELMCNGGLLGYCQMHQRVTLDHGKVVDRETICRILQVLDPEGVRTHVLHKLRRRKYKSKGLNYIWHIDGYDKLKPFGFCMRWIQSSYHVAGPSNNSPRVIADYSWLCQASGRGTSHIMW